MKRVDKFTMSAIVRLVKKDKKEFERKWVK